MPSFATPLDLSTLLTGNNDPTTLEPDWVRQAQILLDLISDDIAEEAGVPIEAGSGAVTLAGTWSPELELPAGPIRSVTSITIDGQQLATGWWTWAGSTLYRSPAPTASDLRDDAPPHQGAAAGGIDAWGGPEAQLVVIYDWGFTDVPPSLRSLALRIAARTIGNVEQVTQESLRSYSVTYGSRAGDSGSHVTAAERRRLRRMFHAPGGTIRARA